MVFLSQQNGSDRILETQTSSDSDVFTNVSSSSVLDDETVSKSENTCGLPLVAPGGPPTLSPSRDRPGADEIIQQLNGHVSKDIISSVCHNGCIAELQNSYIVANHSSLVGLSRRRSCSRKSDFQSSNDKTDCHASQLCAECRTERFRRQLSSCSSEGSSTRKVSSDRNEKRRKSSLGSILGRKLSFGFLRNLSYAEGELTDQGGQTALMCAAQLGNLDLVKELLQREADVRAMDEDKWTPLIFAAREGHLDIVKALVDKGSVIDHADVNGWTALMWASYKGHANVVIELLLRGAQPNVQAHHGVTPIIWAAGRGHADVVRALLRQGAKVNSADKYGTTALVWAARKGHVDCVRALLESGANVDAAGMNSWTALIVASRGGFTEVVSILLEEQPNINAVDKDGLTSLGSAAKEGHKEVVELLLVAGAYVNIQDKQEDTVLIHAVKGGHIEVIRLLLQKFADLDIQGHDKKTALYWAADKGFVDILEAILDCNPDTEIPNKDSETALIRATKNRNREVVRALLDKGAKVCAVDKCGDTALHIAIRFRDKKICELLLRNPKNSRLLYKPNKDGETPYNIDCNHQKGILTQIFGARSFSPVEEADGELSDLCSSSLADILSEPTLTPPITVGLYAKWGSGKSFILKKLQNEMCQFTQQDTKPQFAFSVTVVALVAVFSSLMATLVVFTTRKPLPAVVTFVTIFLTLLAILGLIYYGHRRKWRGSNTLSVWLARQLNYLQLLGELCFCNPPYPKDNATVKALPIRFIFGEPLQLSHLGGEAPLAHTLASISRSVEKKLGFLAARLHQVVKTKPEEDKPRLKRVCCIPRFVFTCSVLCCIVASLILLYLYLLSKDYAHLRIPLCVLSGIVLIAILLNSVNITEMVYQLLYPAHTRLGRVAQSATNMKQEQFLHRLKSEADSLADLVECIDAFQNRQTRMVIFVDGLDSCEQEQILRMLDAIKTLFTAPRRPFIVNLVVDPYIITKAIDSNLHSVFRDAQIRGYDYLRNLIHLPFYLEVGARIRESMTVPTQNHVSPETPKNETTMVTTIYGESSKKDNNDQSSLNRQRSITKDVSQLLASDEQFSDLSPRNMRRLLNIVSITARLLRASNTSFKWKTLAQWINLTERWPYRTSWLIVFCQDNQEDVEEELPLRSVFERVGDFIPCSREDEPLLEMDQDLRGFVVFLTKHSSDLCVSDMRCFLPCTCNLDPHLRKQIRDTLESREGTSPLNQANLSRPQSFGPNFQSNVRASMYSTISDTPSRLNYQMSAANPFTKNAAQALGQPSPASTESSPNALSVKDICDRLMNLEGIDKHAIPRYQARLAQHHINGQVLIQCDLDELKSVLEMSFGDWQLFRAMVMHLREQAVSNSHTPLNRSNTSLDSKPGESKDTASPTTKAAETESQRDYLHMSYEELRSNSQVSSQRSSMHNSQLSITKSDGGNPMRTSIAESPLSEEAETTPLMSKANMNGSVQKPAIITNAVISDQGGGGKASNENASKSSPSCSSESSTDVTALRKASHTDEPDEKSLSVDASGKGSQSVDLLKKKLSSQEKEVPEESIPLLSLSEEKWESKPERKDRRKEITSEASVPLLERSASADGAIAGDNTTTDDPASTTPKIEAPWGKALDRMFENIDNELARRHSPSDSDNMLSPSRAQQVTGKKEPESHDLSLMASYSTFMPPVMERASQSRGRSQQDRESQLKHAKSAGSLVSPGRVRPPKLSEIKGECGLGLKNTSSQSSLRTLNQSFDEFILTQLEEQRRMRMPVLVYEDEGAQESATQSSSSPATDSPGRQSGATQSTSSLERYVRRRDENDNPTSMSNHSIV
ncbi:uncharacterized protein [Apostichopus japonicus]|uniref:uncharacterized protein isoform X3 n=1 Tax=Stichopus japonicus TaxID=307972 RepID=UPI003AB25020